LIRLRENLTMELAEIGYLLEQLGLVGALRLSASRLLSIDHYYVMKRSLKLDDFAVPSKMKMLPICKSDIQQILVEQVRLNDADKRQLLSRIIFLKSGFENCHVIRVNGKIAHMQWIIYPTENGIIKDKFAGKFYPLSDKQVMIENAFTFPSFRGFGYLVSGTFQLLEMARAQGYQSSVCYIRKDNIVSLNEFARMGFKITAIVPEYRLLGKVWRTL
jgi:hypothetical protein